jgi:hypothetical protein
MPVGAPSTIKLLIQVHVVLSLNEARKDGIAHRWGVLEPYHVHAATCSAGAGHTVLCGTCGAIVHLVVALVMVIGRIVEESSEETEASR